MSNALTNKTNSGNLLALSCLMMASLGMPQGALAGSDNEPRAGFFNILPGRSELKLPNLGDISLWKSDMQKAKQAYLKHDFGKARKYLLKAKKNGNFLAGWYLGHIYRLGLGVKVDPVKAFKYYREVAIEYSDAEENNRVYKITLDSLVRVAMGYKNGIAKQVKRDPQRAMRLLRKAANRGHPAGQYELGMLYIEGVGTKKNPREGLRWILQAARKHYPPALARIGDFYWNGKLLKKSRKHSAMMYIIASRVASEVSYPYVFDRLDEIAAQMSEKNFAKGEDMAERWLRRYPPR